MRAVHSRHRIERAGSAAPGRASRLRCALQRGPQAASRRTLSRADEVHDGMNLEMYYN